MILATVAILLASVSCVQHTKVPESLTGVKEVVARLDSAVTAMYGWEPTDSTYNHSIDTLIFDIMDEYENERPDADTGERGEYAIQQKAYDDVRVTV